MGVQKISLFLNSHLVFADVGLKYETEEQKVKKNKYE